MPMLISLTFEIISDLIISFVMEQSYPNGTMLAEMMVTLSRIQVYPLAGGMRKLELGSRH